MYTGRGTVVSKARVVAPLARYVAIQIHDNPRISDRLVIKSSAKCGTRSRAKRTIRGSLVHNVATNINPNPAVSATGMAK